MDTARLRQREHPGGRQRRIRVVLLVILALNGAVAAAKISAGLLIGSLALSADGLHSLLDGAANLVALIGIAVASRPPDRDHPYGHQRFETLTSLAIAGFMFLALAGILQGVWGRLQDGGSPPHFSLLGVGVIGVTLAVNIGVTLWERREARRLNSSLLLADSRHTLSDVAVSISVLVSFGLVWLGFGWADLAVSILIAGVLGWSAWQIVRDASLTLSDTAVEEPANIREVVLAVPGVQGAHAIRSRGGDGLVWVDLHIQVDPSLNVEEGHAIASQVSRRVEAEFATPADVTVHVEPAKDHHLRGERGHDLAGVL